ncbi:hypothetical protein AAG570_002105 [Ranatra chinensis]|uniref:Uncharacterized protein n=1 Tax=Ranatra chinensis TaxID=642074 RepID=A0ABD0Y701_9HEMI
MFRGRPVRFVVPVDTSGSVGSGSSDNLVKLEGTKARAWRNAEGRLCASPELLCHLGCETPRFNYPLYLGKKYRYFYAISSDVDLEQPGTLIKVDTYTKTQITWSESGAFPSEPIFVPRTDSEDEDDGVVLSAVLWADNPRAVAMVALDAKSFIELGRVLFEAPGPVPKCLHGWYASRY